MNYIKLNKMVKKILFVFAMTFLLASTTDAQRIAVVDINQIMESMDEYQSAQTQLDDLASKWRQQIAQEYDKIKGMYNRYQAEQVLMSDEVRKQKEEEIVAKEKEVREMQKQKFGPDGALFKKRTELVKPLQDRVYKAIEDYANDRGFDFIFDKGGSQGLIFSTDRYDKTADILKKIKAN
ncbi:MAG: OmpH family outer membrane protein [Saprospiraceae bacterium]